MTGARRIDGSEVEWKHLAEHAGRRSNSHRGDRGETYEITKRKTTAAFGSELSTAECRPTVARVVCWALSSDNRTDHAIIARYHFSVFCGYSLIIDLRVRTAQDLMIIHRKYKYRKLQNENKFHLFCINTSSVSIYEFIYANQPMPNCCS